MLQLSIKSQTRRLRQYFLLIPFSSDKGPLMTFLLSRMKLFNKLFYYNRSNDPKFNVRRWSCCHLHSKTMENSVIVQTIPPLPLHHNTPSSFLPPPLPSLCSPCTVDEHISQIPNKSLTNVFSLWNIFRQELNFYNDGKCILAMPKVRIKSLREKTESQNIANKLQLDMSLLSFWVPGAGEKCETVAANLQRPGWRIATC